MKIWLDDTKEMPEGFDHHSKTAADAIILLRQGIVTAISLDHDLGSDAPHQNGYFVALFIEMAAHNKWIPKLEWTIHSDNPTGRANMEEAFRKADKYWAS